MSCGQLGFNPPPASSARGTRRQAGSCDRRRVSTHPPLRQRGEPGRRLHRHDVVHVVSTHPPLRQRGEPASSSTPSCGRAGFNPPPASSARGTRTGRRHAGAGCSFNPPPASSARGTADDRRRRESDRVSTHPPLRQRGERSRSRAAGRFRSSWFQPTPRFVSEGNRTVGRRSPAEPRVSTHPPLRQRGEPVAIA